MSHVNFHVYTRDPRTKTGWSRTKRFGPRTGPDQDRKNFRNLGPVRNWTGKIVEIPDQLGPGPRKISTPGTELDQNREKFQSLGPDQDQEKFPNLGPIRTDSDRTVLGPGDPWIPGIYMISGHMIKIEPVPTQR